VERQDAFEILRKIRREKQYRKQLENNWKKCLTRFWFFIRAPRRRIKIC
jgi:hypothetical protein